MFISYIILRKRLISYRERRNAQKNLKQPNPKF